MINFSKTNWLIIPFAILIVATGFFAYQWWQAKGKLAKKIEENENLIKQVNELQTEVSKLKKEIEELKRVGEKPLNNTGWKTYRAEWKDYRNEEYGFEINYPRSWEAKTEEFYKGVGQLSFGKSPFSPTSTVVFSIGVNIYWDLPPPDAEVLSQGEETLFEDIKVYPIIYDMGDRNVIYLDLCFDKNLEYVKVPCLEGSGNFYYQFALDCGKKGTREEMEINQCNQLFNQIVSTFRFIK